MPPVGKGPLPFVLHPLEQPIHGHTMHRDRAASSRLAPRCSLLNVSDNLTLGGLALLWGHGGWHGKGFSFFAHELFLSLPLPPVTVQMRRGSFYHKTLVI